MRRNSLHVALAEPTVGTDPGLAAGRALLAAAREKAELLAAEARERGFLTGLAELRRELAEFRAARANYLAASAEEIVSLALDIAAAVVGEAVLVQPESLRSRVLRAAETLRTEGELTLNINPADSSRLEPLAERLRNTYGVKLAANPAVSPGAARFLGAGGAWELDPAEHMSRIRRLLIADGTGDS